MTDDDQRDVRSGTSLQDETLSADALDLLRLQAALHAGYSGEHAITLAGLMTGSNAEEVESSAADVIKVVTRLAGTLVGPSHDADNEDWRDPAEFADMVDLDK